MFQCVVLSRDTWTPCFVPGKQTALCLMAHIAYRVDVPCRSNQTHVKRCDHSRIARQHALACVA